MMSILKEKVKSKQAFRALTKDDILDTFTSDHDFRSNNGNAADEATNYIGYNLYVFGRRYQENLESAQPT